MPNIWAIAYDLDVRGMKDAGYTKGNVTTFYNSVRQCLTCNRFEKMQQLSIYASDKPNSLQDAFAACLALRQVQDADKFIKRLHLFRLRRLQRPASAGGPWQGVWRKGCRGSDRRGFRRGAGSGWRLTSRACSRRFYPSFPFFFRMRFLRMLTQKWRMSISGEDASIRGCFDLADATRARLTSR